MNFALTSLIVWMAAVDLPVGTELRYTGALTQNSKGEDVEVKSFDFYAVTVMAEDGTEQLAFHVEERGGGGWSWPEQFGLMSLSQNASARSRPIRILYARDDQQYPISLRSPLFEFRDKLALQATWADGRSEYTVTRKRKVKDRDSLQVEVATNSGRNQSLVVETATGILVSLQERVVVGRGDEYQLKMELKSQSQLSPSDFIKQQAPLNSLLAVQTMLHRTGEQKTVELSGDQLKLLQKELPRIVKEADGTTWTTVTTAIERDLQKQQKRIDGLADLQAKLVGQPAPDWKLKLTNGASVSSADTRQSVVVLHFWQYRGEPLVEPYGQIGYLDFLNSKRKKLGVRVIGVNVDERFANPQQSGAALRSMKSLMEFMKLDYDVATDDGSVLSEFGDPRRAGSTLPLWVVIGHDGKIVHCHSGFYDIKPDEGLRQLDDVVVEAVRRQKSK